MAGLGEADLDVDATGNVFVAGSFRGTVDFNPGTKPKDVYNVSSGSSVSVTSGFVLKLTTDGKFGILAADVDRDLGHRSSSAGRR